MKKLLFIFCIIIGCSKNKESNNEAKAGNIPGMGETAGEIQGDPFVLPPSIHLIGDILGNDDDPNAADCVYDGQADWVTVKMELKKDSGINYPTEVVFPPGLVVVSTSEGFQSGLLVEKVVLTIPPTSPGPGGSKKCQVTLMMLCLNEHRSPSYRNVKYKFGPLTNAALIKDLIQKVSGKKLNHSLYTTSSAFNKTMDVVQHALWHITDGDGLTSDDISDINALPNK